MQTKISSNGASKVKAIIVFITLFFGRQEARILYNYYGIGTIVPTVQYKQLE